MAAFKKSFLVLAVALLALAGASGTAYAQHPFGGLISCVANAAPTIVRAEGIAEITGDILMSCTVQGALLNLPAFVLTNFNVTLNVNVTNNNNFPAPSSSAITDAVLIVDEVAAVPTDPGTPCGAIPSPSVPCPQYGRRVGNNGLAWNGVNFPVPGIAPNPIPTTIRISNIRANVSQLGIPTGDASFPSAQVTAFLSVTGTTNVTITNNVVNVATPFLGLVAGYKSAGDSDFASGEPPVVKLQCVSQNIDGDGDIANCGGGCGSGTKVKNLHPLAADDIGTAGGNSFTIRISEGFATAFKTIGSPTDLPGLTQVEAGYNTPSSNCFSPGGLCGGATQGTRFLIRFYNVPNGVRIAVPNAVWGNGRLKIFRISNADARGIGQFQTALAPSVELSIAGNFAYVVYEVVDDDPFRIERVKIPVTVGYKANTPNDLPAVGTMQVSVSFAPISTVGTSSDSEPEPRFVDTGSPRSIFGITRCITNLLFPFVTNQAGFDTGFAISNTSADDKGTTAQAGTCTVFYYGATTGGGAAPSSQTTAVVGAGKQIVWTLSGGNAAVNITGTPGFQGYIMVLCQFQFAHGFAFITDGFGGVPVLAEGYLALIVPWNGVAGSRAGLGGESLGH